MAARFGEMLQERRRQMGLSIQQVANTIKIRPQIIEFFEMGDFSSMPPRGYAQGMISSYSRYLGLNPREVVGAYFDELRAYEQETSSAGGRFQDAAGYVSSRSSGATGRFMMVVPPSSGSRYGQRPPQAGYVSDSNSGHEPQPYDREYGPRYELPDDDYPVQQSGRYPAQTQVLNGHTIEAQAGRTRRAPQNRGGAIQRRPASRNGQAGAAGRGGYRLGGTPDGPRRSPQAGGSYGPGPQGGRNLPVRAGYRSGSGRPPAGGAGSRSRGYQNGGGRPPQGGRGGRSSQRGGNSNTLIYALIAAGLIIIVLLGVLVARGCAPAAEPEQNGSATVNVNPATTDDDTSSNGTDDTQDGTDTDNDAQTNDDQQDAGDDASDPDAEGTKEPEETKVTISVKDGESSWLEVRLDGTIVFGNEVYGPWTQEYTVEESLRITSNTPGSVTVTQNGETVRWDTSTSGVARITINAPEKKTTETNDDADGDAAATNDTTAGDGTA